MSAGDRETWENLGASDPDWAVLSDPRRRHHGWSEWLDEFYLTGATEVDAVLRRTGTPADASVLDWGCGTGRLSFALAQRVQTVVGYDISTNMLALLENRAIERGIANLVVSDEKPSAAVGYDLVISLLVLQHMPSRATALKTLDRMCALVRPGGWLVVEIPDRASTIRARIQPRYRLYALLRRIGVPVSLLNASGLSGISMLTVPETDVTARLMSANMNLVFIDSVTRSDSYSYVRYYAQPMGFLP